MLAFEYDYANVTYSKRQIQTMTHHPLTLALFNIWRRLQAETKPVYSQALRGLPPATTELRVDDVAPRQLITYHKVYIVVSDVRSLQSLTSKDVFMPTNIDESLVGKS